jgi:hypothetical protein
MSLHPSSIPPLCFFTGSGFSNIQKPKRLGTRLSLYLFTPPVISNNLIRIDSVLFFLSHFLTATCPVFSTVPKNDNTFTVRIKCHDCNITIFAASFNTTTTNITVSISYICPHQPWNYYDLHGKQHVYYSPPGFNFSTFPLDHPLRKFGKYLDSHQLIEQIYLNELRKYIWSDSKLYTIEANEFDESYLITALYLLPGTVIVNSHHFPAFESVANDTKLEENSYIESISWVAPWTTELIEILSFIELDASFYALKPFSYSIPMGIYRNKSIPLGLFMFKTENSEMYTTFFKMLIDSGIPLELLQSKGFLTDEGKAIISALHEFEFIRHSCYRHLIEKMGSATILGIITRRLLFCSTQDAYEAKLPETLLELQNLITDGTITPKQLNKLCKIFDFNVTENGEVVPETLDYHDALWNRAKFVIATCSNHLERLHRTLNDSVSGIESFSRRFSIVLQIIQEWPNTFSNNQHRQEKLVMKKLKKQAEENQIEQTENCISQKCGWSAFYSSLFGIENFPCVHTITFKTPLFLEIDFPPFIRQDNHLIVTKATEETNIASQRMSRSNDHIDNFEETRDDTQSDIEYLIETASELMIINPTKYKKKLVTLCVVTNLWTIFTNEDEINEETENHDDEIRSQFRVWLFNDEEIN